MAENNLSNASPEIRLFQRIVEDAIDDIYVVDRENYDLFYANGLQIPYCQNECGEKKKCYQVLYGKSAPCDFCNLHSAENAGGAQEQTFENNGRFYATKYRELDWNGTPAYVKYVRDITEEVNSRKQRERLEQYFQTVVKYLPGGMAVVHHEVGGDLKPEYLSDGFSEMMNMSKEDAWNMYRTDALSGVHPDDRAYVRENLDRCIREKKEKYELQYRLQRGDGDYIWVRAKFSVIQCEGGDARVYADYHDITAEKKMQEQLRKQYQDQLHQHYLFEGPGVLLLGHCNVTKSEVSEIVDHTNSDLIRRFGDDRDAFFTGLGSFITDEEERKVFYSKFLNQPVMQAFENNVKDVVMSCFVRFPNQETGRYVQFKVTLIETPDTGDVTGRFSVTDITEKTIRDKIFIRLSSTNYDLVANVDLFADSYEIVSGGDDTICEERGSNSQRVKKVLGEIIVHSEREHEYIAEMLDPSSMLRKLKEKNDYSFSYTIRNKKGELRTKNMIVTAIDIRIGRVCLIRSDVTDVVAAERKIKEDLEKALEAAKKANRVKSDFLSSMSHDIRTPMNAIVGMTTLALANLNDTKKIEDCLHKISVSSQHLLSLINDILDMSQIEQSQIHLNTQTMRIEELVSHISSIMSGQADHAGLQFQIEMETKQRAGFIGDELRIKQILINLLSNAFKFTPEGGRVLFRIEELQSTKKHHVKYRFTIRDTGIGMSEEFQSHLFEPFIRSDNVAKVEGTGLGLSITKALIDLMNGEIRVESRPNEGTTFEVELEFGLLEDDADEGNSPELEVADEDLSGYHFLLVEDNEINSEILGELLQMRGATFNVKTDGRQAVDEFWQAQAGTYDAIFMDIQMPVMNGYEAARKIRKLNHPDASSIPILAMTANAFAEDVQAAADAGMDGHIAKPVDMKVLYRTIKRILRKKNK